MRKIALVFVFLVAFSASSALAQVATIEEIQNGAYAEGMLVNPCDVVVTAVTYNGFWVAEPPFGPWNGIWVYTGSTPYHDRVPGDVVCICGLYTEYYDLSEIDVVAAGDIYGYVFFTNETVPVPEPSYVEAADLLDPLVAEAWESCAITIVDGMEVTDDTLGYGEWIVTCLDGTPVNMDDVFVDFDTEVALGDCYDNATGIYTYTFSTYKLLPYTLEPRSCGVATDNLAFGAIKALFR